MIQTIQQIFNQGPKEQIIEILETGLKNSNESPFWAEKAVPLADAILSVLIPLREQGLLFNPEGVICSELTPALFVRYTDLANLKWLAFTLQKSNDKGSLQRTEYTGDKADSYRSIELGELATYLSGYVVNLEDEWKDFPIAHYNLHIGVGDVLKKLI
ncbi:MAG: hypothetical protein MUP09_06990 [Thiovulaceae bacterium]|nr:hypothetical protein [Sulfurimonadaceae bacterium]